MVKFYEYFFYRMYWYYVEKGKEDIGNETLSCVFGMSIFPMLNYITIYEYVKYLLYGNNPVNVWEYWIPLTIMLVCNYLYFFQKNRKKRIVDYWSKISKKKKYILDVVLVFYMIVSLLSSMWMFYMLVNNRL